MSEIILVVIGILIALQLNTLKEQRKNAEVETVYLRGILDYWNQDIYELKQLTKQDTLKFEAYKEIIVAFQIQYLLSQSTLLNP